LGRPPAGVASTCPLWATRATPKDSCREEGQVSLGTTNIGHRPLLLKKNNKVKASPAGNPSPKGPFRVVGHGFMSVCMTKHLGNKHMQVGSHPLMFFLNLNNIGAVDMTRLCLLLQSSQSKVHVVTN